ncbi:GroES-like protein [Dothidotthia symphoricarpi CBS 119687]|uniref:GroES-like protein n=1 Tax=Dothidotthia symphoricarpi CBS 119687 TaxID=1392245 RepID=A0A6A6AD05_9PLEO|nr:GroES-like protein [Dothidotthia symphoricarpi CBS 119687]KAF2129143.1 GroES-like protein [Dothidotthia symphoricarpi CBS 119687]
MSRPTTGQTAVIQSKTTPPRLGLPLVVAQSRPLPQLPTPHHVLIRVLAVGLNPTDHKMVTHFFMQGNTAGCDFCGIVQEVGPQSSLHPGDRVAGADFPYRPSNPYNGAFAEYATADSRHVLKIPAHVSDLQAAAIGAIGWGTAALAISDPDALNLPGLPSAPAEKCIPVLVYGGATATGIMAIQMLKLSGYAPIAVCSARSAPLVMGLGAIGTASYTSSTCAQDIQKLAGGASIKHVLDCITDAESAAICFGSLARIGGRYACLEAIPDAWRTRRSVAVKVVMGFEGQNFDVDLAHPVYSRKANPALHAIATTWARELQPLLDSGRITTQPVREIGGRFDGVITALEMLQSGESRGEKLVVRISEEQSEV